MNILDIYQALELSFIILRLQFNFTIVHLTTMCGNTSICVNIYIDIDIVVLIRWFVGRRWDDEDDVVLSIGL